MEGGRSGVSSLSMKEKQLELVNSQNSELLIKLEAFEEELSKVSAEKDRTESLNSDLRDEIFTVRNSCRAASGMVKRLENERCEKEKQLSVVTDQNCELLRLLECEEKSSGKLAQENSRLCRELELVRGKYDAVVTNAHAHEELALTASREGQLRAEEVRLLTVEKDRLEHANQELTLKAQVEVESLQEQLRIRKEKQYQLLERLQAKEGVAATAEDHASAMEEKVRQAHAKCVEVEAQLRDERRSRMALEKANRELKANFDNRAEEVKAIRNRFEIADRERLRMEAEARDSGEQLREMAEKVFQLLERLKLSELAKSRSLEEIGRKQTECATLSKKNSRLMKELTAEGRCRVKAELDRKLLQEQLRAMKSHNAQLAARCRQEVNQRLSEREEKAVAKNKIKTLGSRLGFLLNQVQTGETGKLAQAEQLKKLEAQLAAAREQLHATTTKLDDAKQSNKVLSQALRLSQDSKQHHSSDGGGGATAGPPPRKARQATTSSASVVPVPAPAPQQKTPSDNFALDIKRDGSVAIQANTVEFRRWLEDQGVNKIVERASKEHLVDHIARCHSKLMKQQHSSTEKKLSEKCNMLQQLVADEEAAKRRTMLRYVEAARQLSAPRAVIELAQTAITDEEVHSLAAVLRRDVQVKRLVLSHNAVSDDGAHALAKVLAGDSGLESVDLRGNYISARGIKVLAEALERSNRVHHVYVHASGKIEALGGPARGARDPANRDDEQITNRTASPSDSGEILEGKPSRDSNAAFGQARTVCAVDCSSQR